jgi:hypothetical protein
MRAHDPPTPHAPRRALILLFPLLLCGCIAEQQNRDAAQCQLEGMRTFPNGGSTNFDGPRTDYMAVCMRAKGYEIFIMQEHCHFTTPLSAQGGCYVPTNSFWRKIYKWETGEKNII